MSLISGAAVRNLYAFVVMMLVAVSMLSGAQGLNATQSASNLTQSAPSAFNMAEFSPTINSGLSAYLSNYIPNAVISNSTFFGNQILNGNSYIIMKLPKQNSYIVMANKSSSYTIITNATAINNVLTPFLAVNYRPSAATINYLNSTMRAYENYSNGNLSACLIATGIYNLQTKSSYVCNVTITPASITTCLQNTCDTVPICGGHLRSPAQSELQAFGIPSPFSNGVQNLSVMNNVLLNDYQSYFSLLSKINATNSGTTISKLSSIAANISAIAGSMNSNPVFPPPPNATINACNINLPPTDQPPNCIANYAQYCGPIPFNSAAMSGITAALSAIRANLPTASALMSISANSSATAKNYIGIAAQSQNGAGFASLMNTYYLQYNSIVAKAGALLPKYNNVTLNASVQVLKTEFKAIQTLGVNQSIGVANTILGSLIANSTRIYANASASYSQLYGISQNNSAALIADQLSYQQVPSKLAELADSQQTINVRLNSVISSNDMAGLVTSAQSIRVQSAVFVAPLTVGYMIKVLDTPFIGSLIGSSASSAPQLIAAAPLYAALASLIVGILLIIVIFVITYMRIIKKGKLKGNKGKQRMWMGIFAILIILVAIYTYATYAYASNANSFLPFNYYINTLKASGNAYIALNGSAASNASIISCADTIQGYIANAGKSVQIIRLTNYSCVSGSNISVLGLNCYNNILSSGKPVVLLSQSRQNLIIYRGLYGTVLYASGNVTQGSSCLLSTLFKK